MMTNNTLCLSDDGKDSTDEFESDDDDSEITSVGKGESNRVGSFGNLDANDHETILSPTGYTRVPDLFTESKPFNRRISKTKT